MTVFLAVAAFTLPAAAGLTLRSRTGMCGPWITAAMLTVIVCLLVNQVRPFAAAVLSLILGVCLVGTSVGQKRPGWRRDRRAARREIEGLVAAFREEMGDGPDLAVRILHARRPRLRGCRHEG